MSIKGSSEGRVYRRYVKGLCGWDLLLSCHLENLDAKT